jgi:hypothetical protein
VNENHEREESVPVVWSENEQESHDQFVLTFFGGRILLKSCCQEVAYQESARAILRRISVVRYLSGRSCTG